MAYKSKRVTTPYLNGTVGASHHNVSAIVGSCDTAWAIRINADALHGSFNTALTFQMPRKKRLTKRADQQRAQRIITAEPADGMHTHRGMPPQLSATAAMMTAAATDGTSKEAQRRRKTKRETKFNLQGVGGRISDWNQNRIVVLNNLWGMFSLLAMTCIDSLS